MRRWRWNVVFLVLLFCFTGQMGITAQAEMSGKSGKYEQQNARRTGSYAEHVQGTLTGQELTGQDLTGQDPGEDSSDGFDLGEIQAYLDKIGESGGTGMSFGEIMKMIQSGNFADILLNGKNAVVQTFFGEIRTNSSFLAEILILSLCGAALSGFFGIFGSGQLSETGFYVICLCIQTFLAASFFASIRIAEETLGDILGFMKVLLPAYFIAVTMAGGAVTSASVCGFTLGAIGVIQTVVSSFLLPVMKLYMVLSLVGNLFREEMFSAMTEFLGKLVGWIMKTMFGIVVGFHLIQGLVLPQADAVNNAALMRTISAVPGIGGGAGAVGNLLLGSAVLIKNTAGAAAVVVLVLIAAVPVMKLVVLMVLYYLAAGIMQPVCDKRLSQCMTQTAAGHGMLVKIIGYSLALFAVTIAVISYSTNAAYYAG